MAVTEIVPLATVTLRPEEDVALDLAKAIATTEADGWERKISVGAVEFNGDWHAILLSASDFIPEPDGE